MLLSDSVLFKKRFKFVTINFETVYIYFFNSVHFVNNIFLGFSDSLIYNICLFVDKFLNSEILLNFLLKNFPI